MRERFDTALAAARWLGTKEGSREHREILSAYNGIRPLPRGYRMGEKDPWCAGFVSAAAVMAGTGERYPLECSCSRIIEEAKAMGIWVEDDRHVPQVGDWVSMTGRRMGAATVWVLPTMWESSSAERMGKCWWWRGTMTTW